MTAVGRVLAILAAAVLAVLAMLAWAVPDPVVELIARDRPVLLGRYTVGHVSAAIVLSLLALGAAWVAAAPAGALGRRLAGAAVFGVVLVLGLAGADAVLRFAFDDRSYVHVGELRLRPPNQTYQMTYVDRPLSHRSFPRRAPGYPPFELVMTTDGRGFRNERALERAEIVLVGDSFTEGSRVSDEQTWARLLARDSGRSVYNIANSGDDPAKYAAKLQRYGLPLRPRHVLVMIYEGNDFRRGAVDADEIVDPGTGFVVERYLRFSPLRVRLKRLLIQSLGPLNSHGPVAGGEVLDWLPLPVAFGGRVFHYAMKPQDIATLATTEEEFLASPGWLGARRALADLLRASGEAGALMAVIHAPSLPHVLLPMVRDRLPDEQVRDYVMLRPRALPADLRGDLEPTPFVDALLAGAGSAEDAVRAWCRAHDVPFLSLTGALREATRSGTQVYYSYDQHWSPDGHRVAAAAIGAWFAGELAAGDGPRRDTAPPVGAVSRR